MEIVWPIPSYAQGTPFDEPNRNRLLQVPQAVPEDDMFAVSWQQVLGGLPRNVGSFSQDGADPMEMALLDDIFGGKLRSEKGRISNFFSDVRTINRLNHGIGSFPHGRALSGAYARDMGVQSSVQTFNGTWSTWCWSGQDRWKWMATKSPTPRSAKLPRRREMIQKARRVAVQRCFNRSKRRKRTKAPRREKPGVPWYVQFVKNLCDSWMAKGLKWLEGSFFLEFSLGKLLPGSGWDQK